MGFNRQEYNKAWYQKNKEHVKAYAKKYQAEHREQVNEQKRKWKENNRDKVLAYRKKHYRKNKARILEKNKRLAMKYRTEWMGILESKYGGLSCQYCGFNEDFAAIEGHHIDLSKKEMLLGHLLDRKPADKWKAELDNMILLCSNHHRIFHQGDPSDKLQELCTRGFVD